MYAHVTVRWKKSASVDVVKRIVEVTTSSGTQSTETTAGDDSFTLDLPINSAATIKTTVVDDEGNATQSIGYDIKVGDGQAPEPDTDFSHTVEFREGDIPVPPAPATAR